MTVRITDILHAGNSTWIEDLYSPENVPAASLRNLKSENHRRSDLPPNNGNKLQNTVNMNAIDIFSILSAFR